MVKMLRSAQCRTRDRSGLFLNFLPITTLQAIKMVSKSFSLQEPLSGICTHRHHHHHHQQQHTVRLTFTRRHPNSLCISVSLDPSHTLQ